MNILVTGGAGYKGVKLVAKLLKNNHHVTILDNFMYGFEPILHLVEDRNLTVVKQDIRNKVADIGRYDAIYHLAGLSGLPACAANPSSAQLINVDATKQLIQSLSKEQALIYASTTSFYGKSGELCTESMPVDPVSHYGRTKYQAEQMVSERENSVSLRFATVFGFSPKMRMDLMVNDFTYKALKEKVVVLFDGYAKRTFIHIDDAIDCYVFTLDNFDRMKGNIFNAGGEELNYTKREIGEAIRKFVDYQIVDSDVRDKDLRNFLISYEKIRKIGYAPKRSLEDGIVAMIRIFSYYDYFTHYRVI